MIDLGTPETLERLRQRLSLFDASLPLSRSRTLPREWYFDDVIFEAERQKVFWDSWQMVGRAAEAAEKGSYFTADIAGEPVVVVRGDDGTLRAFANVCRHKAAKVMNECAGKADKLRCRYHGWTYNLRGNLIGTPEFDGVDEFRKEENGLVTYEVGEAAGFIFVHLGKPRESLVQFLSPYLEKTKHLGLEKLQFAERREYVIDCNWKVYVDNYLDGGYHVNSVHPALAGVLDYKQYVTEVNEFSSVQISPLKAGAVGNVRAGKEAYYWWLYPGFMVNIYEGVMDTNLVVPLTTDSCRVVFDFYFSDVESAAGKKFIAESLHVAEQVQQEDITVCGEVQRGLHSRTYRAGRFSVRREAGGYAFHQLLSRELERS